MPSPLSSSSQHHAVSQKWCLRFLDLPATNKELRSLFRKDVPHQLRNLQFGVKGFGFKVRSSGFRVALTNPAILSLGFSVEVAGWLNDLKLTTDPKASAIS